MVHVLLLCALSLFASGRRWCGVAFAFGFSAQQSSALDEGATCAEEVGVEMLQRGTARTAVDPDGKPGEVEKTVVESIFALSSLGRIPSQDSWRGADVLRRDGDSAILELPVPLTWAHVPRTGSSFAFTLFQIESLCPNAPSGFDEWIRSGRLPKVSQARKNCPGILMSAECPSTYGVERCAEYAIYSVYSRGVGKIVGFFRQPEQRLLSAWHHDDCQQSDYADCPDIMEYATAQQGCATKQLTTSGKTNHCSKGHVTPKMVAEAVDLLQTEYIFVGLTDEWNLSICLFNAMFGVSCQPSQFLGSTSYIGNASTAYDVSELGGFVDMYDAPLWELAQQVFYENLRQFDVSSETCVPCGVKTAQTEAS